MKWPNVFLLGAPKSGTTSLALALEAHPQVRFARPKEPKYFHFDFAAAHREVHTLEEYLACFGAEAGRYPVVAEGTVWYLSSEVAVDRILEFNPDARFLVCLRNPVDLAHSLHAQLLYGGDEVVEDFERAWRMQAERQEGRRVPPRCRDPRVLRYGWVASLGEQLRRLYEKVAEDRVHPIVFDDLRSDPDGTYREVLEFLDLEDHRLKGFPVANPSRRLRFLRIARLLHVLGAVKRKLGVRRSFGVWRAASPWISREQAREPLAPAFRRELEEHFADDVRLLARVLDRRLEGWPGSGDRQAG